jgi:hypothetical protein
MSAFTNSGHSDRWKLSYLKFRFRPEAAFRNGALSPTGTVGHGGMTHTKELSEHPGRFNTGFLRALIKLGFSS